QPEDASEKEADAIAKDVSFGKQVDLNTRTNNFPIQPKGEGSGMSVPQGFGQDLSSAKNNGFPIGEKHRSGLEQQMQKGFGDVRIHDDPKADALSSSINAKAFTHGQDIFFKQGEYQPETQQGKELLAHELVHTASPSPGVISRKIKLADKKDQANKLKGEINTMSVFQDQEKILSLMMFESSARKRKKFIRSFEKTTGSSFDETAKKSLEDKNISEDDYELYSELAGTSKKHTFIGENPKSDKDYDAVATKIFEWKKAFKEYEKVKETSTTATAPDVKLQHILGVLLPLQRDEDKIDRLDEAYGRINPSRLFTLDGEKSDLRWDISWLLLTVPNASLKTLSLGHTLLEAKAKDLDFFALVEKARKTSPTAEAIVSDLEKSPHTHMVFMNSTTNATECATPNKKDGSGTTIRFDFGTTIPDGPIEDLEMRAMVIIMHELSHAWRFDRGLFVEVPKYPFKPWSLFPKKKSAFDFGGKKSAEDLKYEKDMKEYQRKKSLHDLTEETEASHMENMVRAELDPDQKYMKLREKYSGIEQVEYKPPLTTFSEEKYERTKVDANVVKPGFDYYKKGEEGKTWKSIHEYYGIEPR
ncbi:MAG: hypothetical protein FD123_4219, partial [Bacteroidetes bacterium]